MTPGLKRLFYNASDGVIDLPGNFPKIPNVIAPHKIPEETIPVFINQVLPRLEIDTFTVGRLQPKSEVTYSDIGTIYAKDIVGKLYSHPLYALSSVNQGYMWNQCRPLIAHFGTQEKPTYLQVRFLHDLYDFSAVNITSVQDSTTVLSILNVAYNGGDKYPNIDKIKDSTILATDLRLRFEASGDVSNVTFSIIDEEQNTVCLKSGSIGCTIKLPYINWSGTKGYWNIGGEENKKWIDYVIYSGNKCNFNFAEMQESVLGLYLSMFTSDKPKLVNTTIQVDTDKEYVSLSYENMQVKALKKAGDEFRIKNDYEIKTR
ncbi:hypothetical protein EZS27_023061 [termite gut metagenome]|uniref:Uncharacterized protein n=1 Tax=termite gut metagenome TaxID=433724 RepID=A0A5J4R2R2_9ZZZZ